MREDPYVYGGSTDMELELEDRLRDKAGAGRGGQGGPTAKELKAYEDKKDANIFTEGKKMPPSPREMKKGGMTASKRADGCCIKGKTRGKMM